MEGQVVIIRLKIAQHPDLIGIMKDNAENPQMIDLDHPHAVIMKPTGDQQELILIPYIPAYAEGTSITFNKSDIFTSFEPVAELRQRFNVQYGSGLILGGNNTIKVPTASIGASLV